MGKIMDKRKHPKPRESKYDKLPEEIRLDIIGMINEGIPYRTIASKYNISHASLIRWSTKKGYNINHKGVKRGLVDAMVAEETTEVDIDINNERITKAARKDYLDMVRALDAARLALEIAAKTLTDMYENNISHAKDVKTWSEVIAINVTTIRRIRGLDVEPQQQQVVIKWHGNE